MFEFPVSALTVKLWFLGNTAKLFFCVVVVVVLLTSRVGNKEAGEDTTVPVTQVLTETNFYLLPQQRDCKQKKSML